VIVSPFRASLPLVTVRQYGTKVIISSK
jgi:hypothetical protein